MTVISLDNVGTTPTPNTERLDRSVSSAVEDAAALMNQDVRELNREDLIRLAGVLMNECSIYSQESLWEMLEQRREAQEDRLEEWGNDSLND